MQHDQVLVQVQVAGGQFSLAFPSGGEQRGLSKVPLMRTLVPFMRVPHS